MQVLGAEQVIRHQPAAEQGRKEKVKGKSNSFTVVTGEDATDFDIVNRIDSILEGNKIEE